MVRPRKSAPKSPELAALGDAIRRLREQRGLTQEQFSDAADLDVSRVGAAETGQSNLTYTMMLQFCAALEISFADFAAAVTAELKAKDR